MTFLDFFVQVWGTAIHTLVDSQATVFILAVGLGLVGFIWIVVLVNIWDYFYRARWKWWAWLAGFIVYILLYVPFINWYWYIVTGVKN